jgi:hypothetical protein
MIDDSGEPTIKELCQVPVFRSAARREPAAPVRSLSTTKAVQQLSPRDLRVLRQLAAHGSAWTAASAIFRLGGYKSERTVLNLVRQSASRARLPLDKRSAHRIKSDAARILREIGSD